MRSILVFFILLFFVLTGRSQKLEPVVISSAGDISRVGDIVFEWTIGESVIGSAGTANLFYTIGFHQPLLISKQPLIPFALNTGINVYPNPVQSILQVTFNGIRNEKMIIQLVDINGNIIVRRIVAENSGSTGIPVTQISQGIYQLKVLDCEERCLQSFKVIKTN